MNTKFPSDEIPDALSRACTAAIGLRERNSEVLALLAGSIALLDCGDALNSETLLQLATDRAADIGDFQTLNAALNEMEAGHE